MKFGNVKLLMEKLAQLRKVDDIPFRVFLKNEYNATPEDLYSELKLDPRKITVENMYVMSESTQYLFPEIIRDAIALGIRFRNFKDKLIAKSGPESGSMVERPYLDFTKIKSVRGKQRTPGETPVLDNITVRSKFVKSKEYGKGIKFPYNWNQLKRIKVDLLPLYFQATGMRIAKDMQSDLVDLLINGDGSHDGDGNTFDESAVTIGVVDKAKGIQEQDFINACVIMSMVGKPVDSMVASAVVTNRASNWEVFKKQNVGREQTTFNTDVPLPTNLNIFPTNDLTGEKMILVCTPIGIEEFIVQPLTVDVDLIVAKRIEEAYATMEIGYNIILRSFRIVIDGTKDYSDSQIPAWLEY